MTDLYTSPEELQEKQLKLQYRLAQLERVEACQNNFLTFVKALWPGFIAGKHHRIMAEKLERVASGDLKRLIVNMPPRHTKSEFASYLFPAWMIGKRPEMKIIQATHTTELAVNFGRKVKNLIDRDEYKEVFPETELAVDSKASGRWDTTAGGMYYGVGVGSNLAGRGADLCVSPDTEVVTPEGTKLAAEVHIGDYLLGASGFERVKHVVWSQHTNSLRLNKELLVSAGHPVFTQRGFVPAEDLSMDDTLYVLYDSSNPQHRSRSNEALRYSRIQHLGPDASAVQQSERCQLPALWRARDFCLRTLVEVQEFLRRHGPSTLSTAYAGAIGQRWPLRTRELRVAGCGEPAEQSPQQRAYQSFWRNENTGSVVTAHGPNAGHDPSSNLQDGHGSRRGLDHREDVAPLSPGGTAGLGRRLGQALSFFGRGGILGRIRQEGGVQRRLWKGKDCLWLPVAIRSIERFEHAPSLFVNFHVTGTNTFMANTYLTHNCIIDDPHSEQTAMSLNGFDDAWDWYTGGPRQRLQPGGAIIVVMCMTGDTPVLRPDGSETPLRDLRPGDKVATYEDGRLACSKINNFQSSGVDAVYKIQTKSGRTVRSNARHPFLVTRQGVEEWVRVKDLCLGDQLVSLGEANGPLGQEPRFTSEAITSITFDGEEEVFDVEVDRTENFIANGVVSHNTRWHEKDLTGQLVRAQGRDALADKWEVIEFPMELPSGRPLWPEFWSFEEMQAVKASIPAPKWNAQYQQNPTGDENAILKREWWKVWEKDHVPQLQYVIQSYDTAFSKSNYADYSAITTWGVFYPEEGTDFPNLILLDAKKGRWDFPELKQVAFDLYKFWDPETVIIEAKASGMPLTHELRNVGIPVVNFTPSRGNDKVSRAHSISPLFESGMIWAPDQSWAHEVIEECAAFPNGEYDDYVDSTTQALMRYRQGNFVQLPSDDWGRDDVAPRRRQYYG